MFVVTSLEDETGFRCVDIIELNSSSFCFKEYRREPEDTGWHLVADYSSLTYTTFAQCFFAAEKAIGWLGITKLSSGLPSHEKGSARRNSFSNSDQS